MATIVRAHLECCETCGEPHLGERRCRCLHDILDPTAFVHATINRWCRSTSERGAIMLSVEEHDELHAEGMAILYKLAEGFRLRLDGYEQDGCFSGYAAWALPKKLGDAWHRMHAEHQHVTQPDGSRRWLYGERAVSLEALTAEDPDRHPIMATAGSRTDLENRLRKALIKRSRAEHEWVVKVGKRLGAGQSIPAIAAELGLDDELVRRYIRAIVRAHPDPRHQFERTSELRAALRSREERDAEMAARVGHLLGEGASVADIADILHLDTGEVRDHEESIRRVWHQIESEGEPQ